MSNIIRKLNKVSLPKEAKGKENYYLIETELPEDAFKNKPVSKWKRVLHWFKFVIDTFIKGNYTPEKKPEPLYSPHWFGGVFNEPSALEKGHLIPMNLWSPYAEDVMFIPTRKDAEMILQRVLGGAGGRVVKVKDSRLYECRPVTERVINPNAN